MKIGPKLILITGILTIMSVAISGTAFFLAAQQSLENRIEAQLETVAVLKENNINNFIGMEVDDIESIAREKAIIDNCIGTLKANSSQEAVMTYRENLRRLLQERIANKENFFELSFLNLDGRIAVSTDNTQEGKFKSAEDYFIGGEKETYFQNFYYDMDLQRAVMTIATPINDSGGQLIGILAGKLNLDRISEVMIERSGLGETGETYLVNKFNLLVSKSRFIEGIEFKKVIRTEGINDCLRGNNGYGYYNNYRDVPVIGLYKWIHEREICLLAEIDQKEAFKPVEYLRNIIIAICAVVTGLGVMLGVLFSRAIKNPLTKLRDAAIQIGKGNLDAEIETASRDEIGELASTFRQMTSDLKVSRTKLEGYSKDLEKQVVERTKELELKMNELERFNKLAAQEEDKGTGNS
jgi:HAMP domain-containing protein